MNNLLPFKNWICFYSLHMIVSAKISLVKFCIMIMQTKHSCNIITFFYTFKWYCLHTFHLFSSDVVHAFGVVYLILIKLMASWQWLVLFGNYFAHTHTHTHTAFTHINTNTYKLEQVCTHHYNKKQGNSNTWMLSTNCLLQVQEDR